MELQINIVSEEALKVAQGDPGEHKSLVTGVAGFSACVAEFFKSCRDDLVRRTELSLCK